MEMSETVVEKEKSEDKKEIEDEEKERMLNEENKERGGGGDDGVGGDGGEGDGGDGEGKGEEKGKGDGAADEGGGGGTKREEKEKGKGPISNVIGSIKVPSFLTRGRSRDGGKDGNPDPEEGKDLLEASSNPSSQAGASGSEGGLKAKLAVFEKIRLPKPFMKKNKEKPQESAGDKNPGDAADGGGGEGGGHNEGEGEKKEGAPAEGGEGGEKIAGGEPDDGMETVKLESDVEKQDADKESRKSLKETTAGWGKYEWRHRMITTVSKRRFIILCGIVLFILLLIVIISIAASSGGGQDDSLGGASRDILHVEGRNVTVITSCGPVQGWVEDGAFAFRGIPYALPPIGKLRWKLPSLLQRLEHCWNGTLVTHNATAPQPNACWQTFRNGSLDGSEDCLTVDVFAPRTKRNSPRLPIVVLVAAETLGGGGGKGSISPRLLSPKLARAAGVILVRVRFRLGALGFLSARALTQSSSPPRSGNYGLADVRAALEWVNLNAMAFGGDPLSITVLGHRAGATLVMALATSRKAHRLFSRAWLSGPAAAFPPGGEAGQSEAEKQGETLMQSLRDCEKEAQDKEVAALAACLSQVDAEDILDAAPEEWKWKSVDLPSRGEDPASLHRWLVVDGDVLNETPLEAWARHGLQVPLVIGTLSHGEATSELRRRKDWSESRTVAEHLQDSAVGEARQAEEAMRLYDSPSFPPSGTAPVESPAPLARLTAMITDIRSICPLLNFTRAAAGHANVPIYFYTAASLPEESGAIGAVPESPDEPDVASALIGPGADLSAILSHPLHESEGGLSSAISRMFYTYVRHGPTVNTTGSEMEEVGSWPESKMPNRLMLIGRDGKVESVADYPRCEFWTKAGFVPQYARLD